MDFDKYDEIEIEIIDTEIITVEKIIIIEEEIELQNASSYDFDYNKY